MVENTGTSKITGNVGTTLASDSAFQGFGGTSLDYMNKFSSSPMLVGGRLYSASHSPPTPDILDAAVSNMDTAYSDASQLPGLCHGITGNHDFYTMVPAGVTYFPVDVNLPSDHILIVTGDVDDFWVLQIGGDLTFHKDSSVELFGGAKPENIFWVVKGNINVFEGATVHGIMLSQEYISLASGSTLTGAAYAQTSVWMEDADIIGVDDCVSELPGNDSKAGGDPHFLKWNHTKFDYHGECDLVLIDNNEFSNGLGNTHDRSSRIG